jgi:hypothetical protein
MPKRPFASKPHVWEDPVRAMGVRKTWENESANPGGDDEWSSDSDTDWYEEVSASDAGANLVECLVHLFLEGRVSAKNLCVLCWWAWKCGVTAAAELADKPNTKATGHFPGTWKSSSVSRT